MSVWYTRNLGDAMLAVPALDQLRQQFETLLSNENTPGPQALFVRHESAGDLHCELVVYLTPASAELAGTVDARACPRPVSAGLELYCGSTEAWSLLQD
jgi:hypothetical protein